MTILSSRSQKQAATIYPIDILTGQDLTLKQGTTIGDTLKQELGIHSSSFGSSVGRPVIRGQVGSRVQVLQNGISSLDVSAISPDHANSTEGVFAEQIEILRGPASLLYGSGTIGGIINVIDNRIPIYRPESAETVISQRYNSISNQWDSALKYNNGFKQWAWHLDGFFRDSSHYNVPKRSNGTGFVANTNAQSWAGTMGSSWIDDWGMVGFSFNHLDNNYGIPPVDELVRIDVQQNRYDLKARFYQPVSWIDSLKFRFAYNDYQHAELEDGIIIGTQLDNQAIEGRVELQHGKWGFINHGTFGFQSRYTNLKASGEEAFVPPSVSQNYVFFAIEDIYAGKISYEMGFRIEHQKIDVDGVNPQQFIPLNLSISALWSVTDNTQFSLAFTRAQRAPHVQELFSDGVHFATQSFELGNQNLQLETSYNLELAFQAKLKTFYTGINLFHNWSKNYITQKNTGQLFDLTYQQISTTCPGHCLPVLQTVQQDGQFYGFESQISFLVWDFNHHQLNSQLFSDYVRGRFNTGDNVPRMPPLRYGVQLGYTGYKNFSTRLKFTRVEKQTHTSDNETPTKGYLLLGLTINYNRLLLQKSHALFFIKGYNLLNETIRHSSSFLKDFVPESGRGVVLGIRVKF